MSQRARRDVSDDIPHSPIGHPSPSRSTWPIRSKRLSTKAGQVQRSDRSDTGLRDYALPKGFEKSTPIAKRVYYPITPLNLWAATCPGLAKKRSQAGSG